MVDNLRQAMAKSRRNYFSFEHFEVDEFLNFLRNGGAKSTPYNGCGYVTSWELYTLFTEHLHKTRFYTAKDSDFLPWPFWSQTTVLTDSRHSLVLAVSRFAWLRDADKRGRGSNDS